MFSSTRLTTFVCIALGIAASAAPAGPGPDIEARDLYDLSGGVGALLLGLGGEGYSGEDSDEYILKRQLAGLDIGSRLGGNLGLAHAATLGEGALGLGNTVSGGVEARSPDLYDLSGGVGALLLGLGGEGYGGEDSDEYILKRQLAGLGVEARSPDLYDLSGGVGALLLGLGGGEGFSGEDSDEYILKRQLAGLDIGSRLGANMGLAHAANLGQGALGLSSSPNSGVEARSPDLYDLTGGLGALLLGVEGGEGYGGEDSDEYILKRQLAGLDIGSRLGANMGLAHAANLGQGALGLSNSINSDVEARSPDLYDLSGGVGALLLGLGGEGYGGEDSDEYILKRQLAGVEARSPDLYDLSGGVGALLLGLGGGEGYSGEDSDEYILKRQLAGLDADL